MSRTQIDKLEHIVDGFNILNAGQAVGFTVNLMMGLSDGFLDSEWSEETRPAASRKG